MMKRLIAGTFVIALLCSVSTIEAGQPKVYARADTSIGVWTVESGSLWNKSWVLCLRTNYGTMLDAKPIGGGGESYRSYIRRIEMQKNEGSGVYLFFAATDKYGRVGGTITDNNFNWCTRMIERVVIERWQEYP